MNWSGAATADAASARMAMARMARGMDRMMMSLLRKLETVRSGRFSRNRGAKGAGYRANRYKSKRELAERNVFRPERNVFSLERNVFRLERNVFRRARNVDAPKPAGSSGTAKSSHRHPSPLHQTRPGRDTTDVVCVACVDCRFAGGALIVAHNVRLKA